MSLKAADVVWLKGVSASCLSHPILRAFIWATLDGESVEGAMKLAKREQRAALKRAEQRKAMRELRTPKKSGKRA